MIAAVATLNNWERGAGALKWLQRWRAAALAPVTFGQICRNVPQGDTKGMWAPTTGKRSRDGHTRSIASMEQDSTGAANASSSGPGTTIGLDARSGST